MKASIKAVSISLPPQEVSNADIEQKIRVNRIPIEPGFLGKLLGSQTRYFAADNIQVSDLACEAARKILSTHPDCPIDLLIFAAASSDLIEPATANIVQYKLGLTCPVMDIKNACNSVVSAIHVASAFIESGIYQHVLIVTGEKLNEVINYNPRDNAHLLTCLSAYGLGDAGAAVLIGNCDDRILHYQKFISWGQYWDLCTVAGGGSMAFRDFDKYYFEGDSKGLRDVFLTKGFDFFTECIKESGWAIDDIDCVVSHQVSSGSNALVAKQMGIPEHKFINTFRKYGNTAAATIPLALHEAVSTGKLAKGDKLLLLGLAAGVSLSIQLIEW